VERYGFVQYLDGAYPSLTNMLCANDVVHPRHTLSMQQHVELLKELIDRTLDIYMV